MKIPNYLKGAVLLAAAFAGGLAAGVALERRSAPQHASLDGGAHDSMQRLTAELHLDAEQQRAIADVLARHQQDVNAAWHAMQPHVRSTMELAHKEIEDILRPDQAAAFRKMVDARHAPAHR
jgi:hypothetical protein